MTYGAVGSVASHDVVEGCLFKSSIRMTKGHADVILFWIQRFQCHGTLGDYPEFAQASYQEALGFPLLQQTRGRVGL